ncbi:hypothetical protein SNEBB_000617 [Seison nebaliae]|nr:hypothetical protein SNEBB_000617 [Seison nebaliae]
MNKKYYSIHWNNDHGNNENINKNLPHIVENLKDLKTYPKNVTFTVHANKEEAEESLKTYESNPVSNEDSGFLSNIISSPAKPSSKHHNRIRIDNPIIYPNLKLSHFLNFRGYIIDDNCEKIKWLVRENPKYLYNSESDSPPHLHEMVRWNAMHFMVKYSSKKCFKFYMNLLSNREQMKQILKKIHPIMTDDSIENAIDHLIDHYFNLPSKSLQLPLHIAIDNQAWFMVRNLLYKKNEIKTTTDSMNRSKSIQNYFDYSLAHGKLGKKCDIVKVCLHSERESRQKIIRQRCPHVQLTYDLLATNNSTTDDLYILAFGNEGFTKFHLESIRVNGWKRKNSAREDTTRHYIEECIINSCIFSYQIAVTKATYWPSSLKFIIGPFSYQRQQLRFMKKMEKVVKEFLDIRTVNQHDDWFYDMHPLNFLRERTDLFAFLIRLLKNENIKIYHFCPSFITSPIDYEHYETFINILLMETIGVELFHQIIRRDEEMSDMQITSIKYLQRHLFGMEAINKFCYIRYIYHLCKERKLPRRYCEIIGNICKIIASDIGKTMEEFTMSEKEYRQLRIIIQRIRSDDYYQFQLNVSVDDNHSDEDIDKNDISFSSIVLYEFLNVTHLIGIENMQNYCSDIPEWFPIKHQKYFLQYQIDRSFVFERISEVLCEVHKSEEDKYKDKLMNDIRMKDSIYAMQIIFARRPQQEYVDDDSLNFQLSPYDQSVLMTDDENEEKSNEVNSNSEHLINELLRSSRKQSINENINEEISTKQANEENVKNDSRKESIKENSNKNISNDESEEKYSNNGTSKSSRKSSMDENHSISGNESNLEIEEHIREESSEKNFNKETLKNGKINENWENERNESENDKDSNEGTSINSRGESEDQEIIDNVLNDDQSIKGTSNTSRSGSISEYSIVESSRKTSIDDHSNNDISDSSIKEMMQQFIMKLTDSCTKSLLNENLLNRRRSENSNSSNADGKTDDNSRKIDESNSNHSTDSRKESIDEISNDDGKESSSITPLQQMRKLKDKENDVDEIDVSNLTNTSKPPINYDDTGKTIDTNFNNENFSQYRSVVNNMNTYSEGNSRRRISPILYCKKGVTNEKCENNVPIYINRLDSDESVIQYDYKSVGFCQAETPQITKHKPKENLGQILLGERLLLSPFNVEFLSERKCKILCTKTFGVKKRGETKKLISDFQLLKRIIHENYVNHWISDNLPILFCYTESIMNRNTKEAKDRRVCYRGIPIGCYFPEKREMPRMPHCKFSAFYNHGGEFMVFNHFEFTFYYHSADGAAWDMNLGDNGGRIVRVEVELKSFDYKSEKACGSASSQLFFKKDVKEIDIRYTYSVDFKQNNSIKWSSRWDYILEKPPNPQIQWFSIGNSMVTMFVLSGMVAMVLLRTVYKDVARYNKFDNSLPIDNPDDPIQEEFGWKLVHADIFRAPYYYHILSALSGTGIQLSTMLFITLFLACLGFLSPASRGALTTCGIVVFVLLGSLAGYTSSRLFKFFGGKQWKRNAIFTSILCPAILYGMFFILNVILYFAKSSSTISFGILCALLALWFGISVPLVMFGAYFGNRQAVISVPVHTNQIPRQIPDITTFLRTTPSIIIGGLLPFGCIFIQLFFIFNSIWAHQFYYMFGLLFFVYIFLIITIIETSILLCYFQLCAEDYRWWWRSFFTGGSIAFYLFLYSIHYYIAKSEMVGATSMFLYFGYCTMICFILFVFSGTLGFFACFLFLRYIYSVVKVD